MHVQAAEAKEVVVPLSRLLKYNAPEWPWAVVGVVASGVNGAVQPTFAFLLVSVIIALYEKDKVGAWGCSYPRPAPPRLCLSACCT